MSMDTDRIRTALRGIDTNARALEWLEQYGPSIDEPDWIDITVRCSFAGSCDGAKEAAAAIREQMYLHVKEAITAATASCRDAIEASKRAIQTEVAKGPTTINEKWRGE